jgi:hypothetical protein
MIAAGRLKEKWSPVGLKKFLLLDKIFTIAYL